MGRVTRAEKRENLIDRLRNSKYEQALKYIKGAGLSEDNVKLLHYLAEQFGNPGWIDGEISILIEAALRSIPGYS